MNGMPVKSTDFRSLRPLGLSGQLAVENWEIIQSVIKQHLGSEHASFFLEPVIDRDRGTIDWYLPAAAPKSADELPRQELLHKAHKILRDVQTLARGLCASNNSAERFQGEMLSIAVNFPGEDYIIAAPYGPALIAWGHERTEHDITPVPLTGRGAQQAAPAENGMDIAPPPLAKANLAPLAPRTLWPLLLLLGLVLLILLLLLAGPAGLLPVWDFCRHYWLWPLLFLLLLLALLGLWFFLHRKRQKEILARQIRPASRLQILLTWKPDQGQLELTALSPDQQVITHSGGGHEQVSADQKTNPDGRRTLALSWKKTPASGRYEVLVACRTQPREEDIKFDLVVVRNGKISEVICGQTNRAMPPQTVCSFGYPS